MPSSGGGWKKAFKPTSLAPSSHPYSRPSNDLSSKGFNPISKHDRNSNRNSNSPGASRPAPQDMFPAGPMSAAEYEAAKAIQQQAYSTDSYNSPSIPINSKSSFAPSSNTFRSSNKSTNDSSLAHSFSSRSAHVSPVPQSLPSIPSAPIGPARPVRPLAGTDLYVPTPTPTPTESNESNESNLTKHGKQYTVHRERAGMSWNDNTLLEWDPAHFRLFVGNLSGEVTDDMLRRAFSTGNRFPSMSKVKVVREKKPPFKTKGFGFVAFSDPDDYFKAFKEMNGKYVGNHPIQLKKATTEIKPVEFQKKKKGKDKGDYDGHANIGPAPPPLAAALIASTKIKTTNLKKSKPKNKTD